MFRYNVSDKILYEKTKYTVHPNLYQSDGFNEIRTLVLNSNEIIICLCLSMQTQCIIYKNIAEKFSNWSNIKDSSTHEIDIFYFNNIFNDIVITSKSYQNLDIFSYNNDTLSERKNCSFDYNFQINLTFYFFTYDISGNNYKLITNLDDQCYKCDIIDDNKTSINNTIEPALIENK